MIEKFLRLLKGFSIIITIQIISDFIVKLTHLPIPGSILGLVLFVLLLKFKIVNKNHVEDCVNLILKYMPLLFVPLFVGVVSCYDIFKNDLLKLLLIIIISTFIVLLFTALTVETIIKFIKLSKLKEVKRK